MKETTWGPRHYCKDIVLCRRCLGEFDIDKSELRFQSRTFGNTEGYIGYLPGNVRSF